MGLKFAVIFNHASADDNLRYFYYFDDQDFMSQVSLYNETIPTILCSVCFFNKHEV